MVGPLTRDVSDPVNSPDIPFLPPGALAAGLSRLNRWAKEVLPVPNPIVALDVLIGIYLAERAGEAAPTFKELCWDLRYSEQAIRTTVDRLKKKSWVIVEQDSAERRFVSRLRIEPARVAQLEEAIAQVGGAFPEERASSAPA